MLPRKAIKEFREISKKKGVYLNEVEAVKEAHSLINLFRVINGQKPVINLELSDKQE